MGKHHTGNIALWFHVLVEVWLHEVEPLLDATLDVAVALTHIAQD